MKRAIKYFRFTPFFAIAISSVLAGRLCAQPFTLLHSFLPPRVNPLSSLVSSSNTLYGTTFGNAVFGDVGSVFRVRKDGSGFETLYSFPDSTDGAAPQGNLILSSNTLYGTTTGVPSGYGSVFKISTDGTGFTTLHSFTAISYTTNTDGAYPLAGLVLLSSTLYGTTAQGGASGNGTVFKIKTDGTDFTTLYSFTGPFSAGPIPYQYVTNADGAVPRAGLVLVGDVLYGTASQGGAGANGTVFALKTDGAGFKVVHAFTASGSDGSSPRASLLLSGNIFYGTTIYGGSAYGTVFSISFAPQLSIIRLGPDVILSWPTNYSGFDYSGYTLQSTTNLAAPIWTNLLPPVVVNGLNTVTNRIANTQQFYRLSQ